MRPFEILTQAALLPLLLGYLLPRSRRPRWLVFLPGLATLFVLAHLLVEGWRWQMITTYALTALLLLASLHTVLAGSKARGETPSRKKLTIVGAVAGLLVLADAAAQLALFPVFELPQPSGPYAVGRTKFQRVDASRLETLTPDSNDRRALMVEAWYPATRRPGTTTAAYWEGAPLFLNHLARVRTHSHPEAPLADDRPAFPVLIFSHGCCLGYAAQNTVLMEELASHGYVVFSIDHPYEALAVTFPDGRRAFLSVRRALALLEETRDRNTHFERLGVDREDLYRDETLLRQMFALAPLLDESLRVWTADTLFVMDELERMNAGAKEGIFTGRLDLSRLGLLGMSLGGATAGQVCLVDRRCQAGINLDSPQLGDMLDGALDRPFMVVYGENAAGMNDLVYRRSENTVYSLTIEGAFHGDFADFTIMSPLLKPVLLPGSIDGRRMSAILNAYVLAFFDEHLKGEEAPLLDGPSPAFPEVEFEIGDPPGASSPREPAGAPLRDGFG